MIGEERHRINPTTCRKIRIVRCRCECGAEHDVTIHSLGSGASTQCSPCASRTNGRRSDQSATLAALHAIAEHGPMADCEIGTALNKSRYAARNIRRIAMEQHLLEPCVPGRIIGNDVHKAYRLTDAGRLAVQIGATT